MDKKIKILQDCKIKVKHLASKLDRLEDLIHEDNSSKEEMKIPSKEEKENEKNIN